MFTKSLASLAIAATLVSSSASIVLAKDHGLSQKEFHSQAQPAKPLDPICMGTAVDKRESTLITGLDAYNAAVKSALAARRDALKAAWAMTDVGARKDALKKIWHDFNGTQKNQSKLFKTVKKDSWKMFHDERKLCGGKGGESDDGADARVDAQL